MNNEETFWGVEMLWFLSYVLVTQCNFSYQCHFMHFSVSMEIQKKINIFKFSQAELNL